ncbi:MAG TPA: acetate/propionate family kinase [Tepidisphaeraceae bacterium]|jgi:acetate kinase|nr:acetate/propionate family kinase [Tepidisphaeraceae bacterium]
MHVLVANLGSTSFKYKLLDTSSGGTEVARGGYERIGQAGSPYKTHGEVIDVILKEIGRVPDAIGFKAVHGGPISGAVRVTDEVLATMEQFADVAPAHNPPYIAAMRAFREKLPNVPQVAAFETAFHQTIPLARQIYAIPHEWTEKLGIRRYGFHGASHRYIATRVPELVGSENCKRIISCHLGGSCSMSAIENGQCVANTFGMTAQSGLPQNNRVGDFDTFALLKLLKQGISIEDVFRRLGKEGGMLGMSGVSNDMRDIEKAAAEGNARAQLAIDAFVEAIRGYLGSYLVALGGCDVLAFTGGIGENGIALREAICKNLQWAGIELDPQKNQTRSKETKISSDASRTQIWIVPTNEELIVARQTVGVLSNTGFQPVCKK